MERRLIVPSFLEEKIRNFVKVSTPRALDGEERDGEERDATLSESFRAKRAAILEKNESSRLLDSDDGEQTFPGVTIASGKPEGEPEQAHPNFLASVCWNFGAPALRLRPAEEKKEEKKEEEHETLQERTLAIEAGVCLQQRPVSSQQQGREQNLNAKTQQELYSAENQTDLQGAKFLGRHRSQLTGEALCVYDNTEAYLTFLREVFGVEGLDGKGSLVRSTIQYGRDYGNAFYDGQQMVYGEGDGRIFKGFSCDFSVVAHELSHGFSGNLLYLEYKGQAGALNESLSDVFACAARHWREKKDSHKGAWVIGDKIMDPPHVLRSMSLPGSAYRNHPVVGNDPQVGHMRDLYVGEKDEGGVHVNSGIPNKAFYLFAKSVGGNSWEKPAQIWFRVLKDRLITRNATFEDFALATLRVAQAENPKLREKLRAAWLEVGVRC